jgi:hypothetical protein
MGAEMLYILQQRLHAQNISKEKGKRGASAAARWCPCGVISSCPLAAAV